MVVRWVEHLKPEVDLAWHVNFPVLDMRHEVQEDGPLDNGLLLFQATGGQYSMLDLGVLRLEQT